VQALRQLSAGETSLSRMDGGANGGGLMI